LRFSRETTVRVSSRLKRSAELQPGIRTYREPSPNAIPPPPVILTEASRRFLSENRVTALAKSGGSSLLAGSSGTTENPQLPQDLNLTLALKM